MFALFHRGGNLALVKCPIGGSFMTYFFLEFWKIAILQFVPGTVGDLVPEHEFTVITGKRF
jgi:hypothetical protein